MLLERFEPMFQLFDMAFLAFPECPLTVINISIRSPPGGGGVGWSSYAARFCSFLLCLGVRFPSSVK